MKSSQQNLVTYKREKNKVEITGDPKDIKGLIWFDQICSKLWIVITIVLMLTVPQASFIPLLFVLIKRHVSFLILLAVVDTYSLGHLLFSG
jgi:hypothetical protein